MAEYRVIGPGDEMPRWPQPLKKGKWTICQVVPADLARELYEALKGADEELMKHQRGESGLDFEPAGKVIRPALEYIYPALARYEREVES